MSPASSAASVIEPRLMKHVKIVCVYGCVSEIRHSEQWLTEGGGFMGSPPHEIPMTLQNRAILDPTVKTIKIAEFRTPTPQDVRKNAVKF